MPEFLNPNALHKYIVLFRMRQTDPEARVRTLQRYDDAGELLQNFVVVDADMDVSLINQLIDAPATAGELSALSEFLADRQSLKTDYDAAITKLLVIENRANADWTNALVFDALRFFAKVIRLLLKFLFKLLI